MNEIIHQIIKSKIVPVFYHDDIQWCREVMKACFQNDIHVFEFTNRGSNALSNFEELKQFQEKHYPQCYLGAGTIWDQKTASDFISAGATFIVSPAFVEEVMQVCRKEQIPYLPGCMTIKEIYEASNAGCDLLKVFPGQVLGPSFIKAVKAVLPQLQLMVTGGVNGNNLKDWLNAGTDAIGSGLLQSVKHGDRESLFREIKSLTGSTK